MRKNAINGARLPVSRRRKSHSNDNAIQSPALKIPANPCVEAFKPVRGWRLDDATAQTGLRVVISWEDNCRRFRALCYDERGEFYYLSQDNCIRLKLVETTRLYRFISLCCDGYDSSDEGLSYWMTMIAVNLAARNLEDVSTVAMEHANAAQDNRIDAKVYAVDLEERGATMLAFQNY